MEIEYNRIKPKQEKPVNTHNCGDLQRMAILRKEGKCMERKIRLTQDEAQNFVNAASKCDFDIDISYNRYVVDAKSFLGVYGLNFNHLLKVSYDGYDAKLEELLNQLTVAC